MAVLYFFMVFQAIVFRKIYVQHHLICGKPESFVTQLPVLIADVKHVSAQLSGELFLETITEIRHRVFHPHLFCLLRLLNLPGGLILVFVVHYPKLVPVSTIRLFVRLEWHTRIPAFSTLAILAFTTVS